VSAREFPATEILVPVTLTACTIQHASEFWGLNYLNRKIDILSTGTGNLIIFNSMMVQKMSPGNRIHNKDWFISAKLHSRQKFQFKIK